MNNSTYIPFIKTANSFPNNTQAVQTLSLIYPSTRPILELTGPVVIRSHPWTHYLPTGLDNLPAATVMYFNLITNRTRPTYNNETNNNNKNTLISTHSPFTVRHVYIKPHIVTAHTNTRL
jgi:hypothetical protein